MKMDHLTDSPADNRSNRPPKQQEQAQEAIAAAFTFTNGTEAFSVDEKKLVLREPTVGDMRDVLNRVTNINNDMELVPQLLVRCCVQYGEQQDIALAQVDKFTMRQFMPISRLIAQYLGEYRAAQG